MVPKMSMRQLGAVAGITYFLRWTGGGSAGRLYGVSKSGWMEADNFITWFKKLFQLFITLDGHHSHLSLELIHTAKTKGVTSTATLLTSCSPLVWVITGPSSKPGRKC